MSHKTQTGLDIYFANKSPTACRRSFITLIVQSSHSKANSPSHIEKLTSKSQRSKTSHFSQFEFSLAASYFRRKLQRIMIQYVGDCVQLVFQGKFHLSVTSSSFTHVLVCWLRFANSSNDHWIHVARIVAMFQHPLLPIFQLGFGFYFILTAFQSCSVIEVAILHSAEAQNSTSHAIDKHAGYYSIDVVQFVHNACCAKVIRKMVNGDWWCYVQYIFGFVSIFENGTAVRSVGISRFRCIFLPTGGLFLYSQFRDGSNELSSDTVRLIFIVFTCMAVVGTALFALLKQMRPEEQLESLLEYESDRESPSVDSVAVTMVKKRLTVIEEIVRTFKLLQSGNMICLVVVFLYSGILLTFWSGVYGTCLTFTRQFTVSTKVLLALNVIFVGLGESLGSGLVFGLIISTIESMGRPVVIILGAVVNVLSFFLIFLYIPSMSPFQPTDDIAYFLPNEYVAILCSFLLGFGDSCWNTQIYATLGSKYTTESTRAFALFKFFNSLSSAVSFFYTSYLLLQWQLVILVVMCFLATFSYFKVENFGLQQSDIHHKMSKNLKTIEIDDTDQARGYFYLFDIEETVAERLIGLTEMLPEGMQKAIFTICSTASELGRKLFVFTRSAMWIAASSAMILILPVMFEKDRADFQQMHLQQQNQILFGPGAAAAYSGQAGSSGDHGGKELNRLDVEYKEASARLVQIHFESWKKMDKQQQSWEQHIRQRSETLHCRRSKTSVQAEQNCKPTKRHFSLANPIEIEELIREGRTRIAIAVHYGNPYPRPVYAFPKTLPIRKVSNQQTEKQSPSMNHRMATNNQIPSTS
ncbi:putative ATP synthase F0, A subunit [Trichinella spiralis]|uniref:putative ATP synthase F0, A subunit n=1 Tax=Trichinella spiralis TaxID=6334 RepID=UPI0001EFC535|nr:putative ATP synthase F0, A subunit [Trichinella spiralis]